MRSTFRAAFVLFIVSALVTACGASGPRWNDILSLGMKFGQCIADDVIPAIDKFGDSGTSGDAATDAPAE